MVNNIGRCLCETLRERAINTCSGHLVRHSGIGQGSAPLIDRHGQCGIHFWDCGLGQP